MLIAVISVGGCWWFIERSFPRYLLPCVSLIACICVTPGNAGSFENPLYSDSNVAAVSPMAVDEGHYGKRALYHLHA